MIAFLSFALLISLLANIGQALHSSLTRHERDDAYAEVDLVHQENQELLQALALRKVAGRVDKRAKALGLIEGARK